MTATAVRASGFLEDVDDADDFQDDQAIEIVNSNVDTSPDAVAAWIAELERDDDWIELPATAAELIDEDRTTRTS
jgi:hypothetical protein